MRSGCAQAYWRSARIPNVQYSWHRPRYHPGMPIYAADVSAAAESVAAFTAVGVVATWAFRTSKTAVSWVRRRRHKELVTVLSTEVVTGPGWAATASDPEVSLEAGIAYAREAARSGHPPHVPTRGLVSPDQPLDYLLDKVAETVWEAVSSAQSGPEPYTLPLRNYLTALSGRPGRAQRGTSPSASSPNASARKKMAGPTRQATPAANGQHTEPATVTCACWTASISLKTRSTRPQLRDPRQHPDDLIEVVPT